jgi:hypothetical protein
MILLVLVCVGLSAACSAPPREPVADASAVATAPPAPTVTAPITAVPEATAVPTVEPVPEFPEYRLALSLDVPQRQLAGRQRVTVPNHTGLPLEELVFRLYPNLPQYGGRMTVSAVQVEGEAVVPSLRADETALVVPLGRSFAPDTSLELELDFQIAIPPKGNEYALFGYSHGIWSLPDAYPLLAVHDGVAWREDIAPAHSDAVFAEAAFYDVSLTLPPTLTLAATGSVLDDAMDASGKRTHHIVGGPLREFAWLASADYQVMAKTVDGRVVESYFLSGHDAAGEAALDNSVLALRAYEEAFGPYPYRQMVVVEAPLLFYGMEFPGLNLVGRDLYQQQGTEFVNRVVHEIAHQWWYAQVGNDQVNVPWLDEGLAEYSMAIYYADVYGQEQAEALINQRWRVPYQIAVENEYDSVVNQPSSAFSWDYEVIVYAKAALFFDALQQELGDEQFRSFLKAYCDAYRWKTATPAGLLQVAETVANRELDELYDYWILGSQ